jgi:hypothetical protein
MVLACKETGSENEKRGPALSGETPRAKYETGPRASQKIEVFFAYLKIR